MFRSTLLLGLLLATIYCQSVHSQCSMIPVSLDERINESVLVVEGKIINVYPLWNSTKSGIFTISEIEIFKVFKGENFSEKIILVTAGGRIGDEMMIVEPELNPEIGQIGVFFLKLSKVALEINGVSYEPVAASQGLIEYVDHENKAAGVFEKYHSISEELYPSLYKRTNVQVEIKSFNPAQFEQEAGSPMPLALPTITNISPSTTTAGTFSIITITGSNFGASYDAAGSSSLSFKNANTGGSNYIAAPDNHIVSWTNTEIQAYVPSGAGTGTIQVTNNTSETTTSGSTITINYNQSNPTDGTNYYEPNLIRADGVAGYLFSYSTSTSNNGVSFDGHANAKSRFESALDTWRCNTGFNVDVTLTTNTTSAATNDGINAVLFDNDGSALPSGVLGRATSRYGVCGSEAVLTEIDVVFKRDGTDGVTWYFGSDPGSIPFTSYDFESVALHEVGHGHQLGHIISSGAVMHYSIANSQISRTPSAANDIAGGMYIISNSSSFSNCGLTGMTSHSCALPVVLLNFSGEVKNNMVTLQWITEDEFLDYFVLERSVDGIHFYEIEKILSIRNESNVYSAEDFLQRTQTYYRLKMVEHDGSYDYSKVISLTSSQEFLRVYPNPSPSTIRELFVKSNISFNEVLSVQISDAIGKIIPVTISGIGNRLCIQKPGASGIYYILLITRDKKVSASFIVE